MEMIEQKPFPGAAPRTSGRSLRFSLVLATMGRTAELANFLSHLDRQSYRNFELLVIDQNGDDRLIPILGQYDSRFIIKHLRSEKGLSRGRNVGLQNIAGDVVAFPDDDCFYLPWTLRRVHSMLIDNPDWDGVTVGVDELWASRVFDPKGGFLSKYNVWRRAISYTIFLRTTVVRAVGKFDPMLGVGSESGFGSSEEMDYLLRAIEEGQRIYYQPDRVVKHPDTSTYDAQKIAKAYKYALGGGYVLRKHYPRLYFWYRLLRPFAGCGLALAYLNFSKSRYHWAILRGRVAGWNMTLMHSAGAVATTCSSRLLKK
jgi:glycosyltransferase involved in cell wall biosynthesis